MGDSQTHRHHGDSISLLSFFESKENICIHAYSGIEVREITKLFQEEKLKQLPAYRTQYETY
jgi:hypothetical protein